MNCSYNIEVALKNVKIEEIKRVRVMTKADIVDVISSSTGLTKVETEAVVNGFMETVIDAMKRGERIELRGFGSFKVVKRAPRKARNPKTNEELIVPEQYVPVLKMSDDFKDAVNEAMMDREEGEEEK